MREGQRLKIFGNKGLRGIFIMGSFIIW